MCMCACQQFVFTYTGHLKSPSEAHYFLEFSHPLPSNNWQPSIRQIWSCCYYRARLIAKNWICAYTPLHQISLRHICSYMGENNMWLLSFPLVSGERARVITYKRFQANLPFLLMTNENCFKEIQAMSIYKRWHCFHLLTTGRKSGPESKLLHISICH